MMANFAMYGEEPVVFPNEPDNGEPFAPRAHAEQYVKELFENI